jgi:hypothetical protein
VFQRDVSLQPFLIATRRIMLIRFTSSSRSLIGVT